MDKMTWFLGCMMLLVASCQSYRNSGENETTPAWEAYFDQDWAMNKLWEDGQAEVAIYDAQVYIYNKPRQFEYKFLTVKEDFDPEMNVKASDYNQPDLIPVIKQNQFARVPTENYPYHFLTSVFVLRKKPEILHKMTFSSQEWCGITLKEFTHENGNYQYHHNSYFPDEGTGDKDVDGPVLFEEQLFLSLRALQFEEGLNFEAEIIGSELDNNVRPLDRHEATISVSSDEVNLEYILEDDTLSANDVWKVTVALDNDKLNHYWIEKAYPNRLLKAETWEGTQLSLKEISRYAYWGK